ncbi:MAG: Histidinol dehydrogenase [Pseudomonadota bacterium]|jgi:histidinol dehydrogenase
MLDISILNANSKNFWSELDNAIQLDISQDISIQHTVNDILMNVKTYGDKSVIEYTNKFDNRELRVAQDFCLTPAHLKNAFDNLAQEQKDALQHAYNRLLEYHQRQRAISGESWEFYDEHDNLLGQKVSPIDSVGIYVPGGKASYPSSVLMNAVPAKVAGVPNIVMVVPSPQNYLNDLVLAAAHLAGVNKVYTIGGAQAIAALAYGTQTIPAVNKIVGPGNAYVAQAKRQVFGKVGIDMIAGPSEILIIADGSVNPDWVAMDLFSQAEHDELAQSILVSLDEDYSQKVIQSMNKLIEDMPRKEIIAQSINNRGLIINVNNIQAACKISNYIAPEHLEISSAKNYDEYLPLIQNAGAIFIGAYSSEALGDYCAGPNHVLPTSGTAKFSSPLGVYDFQKRSSILHITKEGANELGSTTQILALGEGLQAHAKSAEFRMKKG